MIPPKAWAAMLAVKYTMATLLGLFLLLWAVKYL